ncbi:MAG TPA: cyclase family protein [Thermoanaerobaculia bacterium]|nr:cyclase family protein [Thermoanaerobaculia bacterium]
MRRRIPGAATQSASPRIRPARRGAVRKPKDRAPDALKIFDISRRISERTPVWPGDVRFSFRHTSRLADRSLFESTCFTMSAHVGTHADAPSHVIDGEASIGDVALEPYVGRARVIDLAVRGEVGADALPPRSLRIRRILFRTRGRAFLSPLAALRLAERGAILVGTDALSIDPEDAEDLPAHRTLLSRGVALLEHLALDAVDPGDYQLVALPLRFDDLDASPVRAILIRG